MRTSRRARIRDYFLYVVIASTVFLGLAWLAFYKPSAADGLVAKWIGLAFETAIVAELLFAGERRSPLTILLWLMLHCILWVPLLIALEVFRPFWWGVACPAEYVASSWLLERMTFRSFAKRSTRPQGKGPREP
jgi:hypothetical protein